MKISDLPVGSAPQALQFPHFPAPYFAVIWRNWNLVKVPRLAEVLRATPAQVMEAAALMGLEPDARQPETWQERGYLTIVRRNWHLLNYEQMLQLLDWTPEHMAFTLREDDFLWIKFGQLKPQVEPVYYHSPTPAETARCAEIKAALADDLRFAAHPADVPFGFLARYGQSVRTAEQSPDKLRMIYSYSALYGDPLLDEKADPFPEALLADYAKSGVNAVWLQGILYTLVPWLGVPELSDKWELRQQGLRRLVERAARHGIKVYLYLNEPRALPKAGFAAHPEWAGAADRKDDLVAFCPQVPEMLQALRRAVGQLSRAVPGLGGFFTISMSENLTHCYSRSAQEVHACPRCADHTPAENVSLVLNAIYDGIRDAGTGQNLIAWSWGWNPAWDEEVLETLPAPVKIMCVSENSLPTECLGISGQVNDYSISKVGPGPVAIRQWQLAQKHGHTAIAKVQLNTTWEISAVPCLPVPQLVRQHVENIRQHGVDDFLMSWTLGGFPGGNLELVTRTVREWAEARFSGGQVDEVLRITQGFSDAFRQFPFHECSLIYTGPTNFGSANLLYRNPTGYAATMVGFPYDDVPTWCGDHYPEEILETAFANMTEMWETYLEQLRALPASPGKTDLWNLAEACYCHLRSSYCQIAFIRRRNAGKFAATRPLLEEEIELAQRLLKVQSEDSRIGFEASNHYAYNAQDLLEKILNCRDLLRQLPG